MRILVVDDDSSVRTTLTEVFKDNYDVSSAISAEEAIELIDKHEFDVIITDNKMSGKSGIDLIREYKPQNPHTSFILITAYATVQQAVEAIKLGADDYMIKPFDIDEVEHRVQKAMSLNQLKRRAKLQSYKSLGFDRMIGDSQNIREAKEFIQKISDVDSNILILGPSGAGKEVMAQTIHETSTRSGQPFVAINCATFSEQLIESELFGHEKGSFTGATTQKLGKFELASDGTIFLDELGEMPIELQSKLLRVLQEKEFTRIGGTKNIKTRARVLAATNRDLKKMVSEGTFREDLYFRLNVLNFELKPLNERKEDILPLSTFLWESLRKEVKRDSSLAPATLDKLQDYSFPGNIRELKNILERMMVLGPKTGEVTPDYLPTDIVPKKSISRNLEQETIGDDLDLSLGLNHLIDTLERKAVEEAMRRSGNNQVKAADLLQIKRGTLQYKLKKYAD